MSAPIYPNWIYTVDTGSAKLAMITARDHAELPAGKAVEAQPVYHGIGGFMLGEGESVDGNRYRAKIGFARGNHFRNLGAWKGRLAFGNGVWTLREGVEISLDHYVSGRTFFSASVGADCAAVRSGKAEIVLTNGGKERRLLELTKAGVVWAKLPQELMPMTCPSIVIRGLAGCDIDLRQYLFDGEINGQPVVPAESGTTEYLTI